MMKTCFLILTLAYGGSPAWACDDGPSQHQINAQRDATRALEKSANSSERQERLLRDQNKMLDRAQRNR